MDLLDGCAVNDIVSCCMINRSVSRGKWSLRITHQIIFDIIPRAIPKREGMEKLNLGEG